MHVKKQEFYARIVDKRNQNSKIRVSRIQDGTLPNFVFSNEKKIYVDHPFNNQNDWVWCKDRDEGPRVVTRKKETRNDRN